MRLSFACATLEFAQNSNILYLWQARVAPMKALSIQKLKLQAALHAIRLKDDIMTALTVTISHVYMWTDG